MTEGPRALLLVPPHETATIDTIRLLVESKRLPVLAALATMPEQAFAVLISKLAQNLKGDVSCPIDREAVSDPERIGLSALLSTIQEYFA